MYSCQSRLYFVYINVQIHCNNSLWLVRWCWLILCDAPAFDAVFVEALVSLTRCACDILHLLTDFIKVVLIVLEAADAVVAAFVSHGCSSYVVCESVSRSSCGWSVLRSLLSSLMQRKGRRGNIILCRSVCCIRKYSLSYL